MRPVTFSNKNVWFFIDEDSSMAHTKELQIEVAPNHVLFEHINNLKVIAKCGANDDVLVASITDPNCFYIVHLTWSGKPEIGTIQCPDTQLVALAELQKFFDDYDEDY